MYYNPNMTKIFQTVVLIVTVMLFQNVDAQKITNKELEINNNVYHISMDKRIYAMLSDAEESCQKTIYTDAPKPINKVNICKESPKLMGYKIQIAITKDGNEASKIRYKFGKKFPELKVEIDTNIRPNHKILVGSYFSKESGNSDLERIKREFRSAILVPYRIFCEESI